MRLIILAFISFLIAFTASAQGKKEILYVGTYSVRGSQGIYAFQFDRVKKTLKPIQTVPSLESPTFIAIHPSGRFLYSVNRGKANVEDNGGSVSAYAIDRKTGHLSGLNHRSSYGDAPCHISIDKTGKFAFVCNYLEGNLVVLPLFDDGLVGIPSDAKKYFGKGKDPKRQDGPHIHSTLISPENKFVYVCDLGTDKIFIYDFDPTTGKLSPATVEDVTVGQGAGPRHLTFHPNGKHAYLVEEMKSSVAVLDVDKTNGALIVVQDTVKALPSDFVGSNNSADIHTDISGKYLYMSNRGHNSISIFSIDTDGKIALKGQQPVDGKTPRNFLMDPKGEYMFVANQDTDTILIYRINAKTGQLTPVGKPVKVPSPVCLKLLTLP